MYRDWLLQSAVLHADETPVRLLDPGAGKTKKAYVWAYARMLGLSACNGSTAASR